MIDLRSDTVTKPSQEMLGVMFKAKVGDDVYKEDPAVNELEEYAADLLGKEAALFVPSGVMGNQLCLNILTNPMDEVICEKDAHIFHYESGSPAALSGIQLCPVEGKNGVLNAEQIEPLIRPTSAYYMPYSKVIEVENTHNRAGGTITPIENIIAIRELAKKYNLLCHLDGARLWNACVAADKAPKEYTQYFDTVSCCLSKGLGAPIGTVIAGPKELIDKAFRVRKAWGGGMRQVGIIAAAGLYALKNNIDRLAEDHEKAKTLAKFLDESDSFDINMDTVQTNILIFRPVKKSVDEILKTAQEKGLLLSVGGVGTLRAVTHMDVSFNDIEQAIQILKN